jgi:uncharacterized membrane protein
MSKRLDYIMGIIMVVVGIVLVTTTYKLALVSGKLFALFLVSYMLLIGGGLLLLYVTKEVHKAAENLQRIEELIEKPVQEQSTPQGVSQIILTLHEGGGVGIEARNVDFEQVIATLEVTKIQLIKQYTGSSKPIEIVKKP